MTVVVFTAFGVVFVVLENKMTTVTFLQQQIIHLPDRMSKELSVVDGKIILMSNFHFMVSLNVMEQRNRGHCQYCIWRKLVLKMQTPGMKK